MKKLIFILFISLLGLFACQKDVILTEQMDESFYVRTNHADIPAYVYGNGASKVFVILLHGGPGGSGLEYRFGAYAQELEKRYAVVYTDQRHQGSAHGHLKDEEITVDAMVEDVHFLVQTLKLRYGNDIRLFLLGHSWGGTLGTAYMVKDDYQHELNGWIEVDGAHDIPMLNIELVKMILAIGNEEVTAGRNTTEWAPILDYVNAIDTTNISFDQTGQLNAYGHEIEDLLTEIYPSTDTSYSSFEYYFRSPTNPLTSAITGAQLPQAFLEEVEATSLTNQLNHITIPTLIQWGEYDFVVPPALGYSAFNHISSTNKFLKIYSHSGHSPMVNEPDPFTAHLIAFIEQFK